MATITREQNIICSKTHLDGTTHEQTIICKQLFAGQVMCSRPMRNKKKASNEKYDLLFSFFPSTEKQQVVNQLLWYIAS